MALCSWRRERFSGPGRARGLLPKQQARAESGSRQGFKDLMVGRGPADDAVLGPDHFERGLLELGEIALRAILDQQAFITAIVVLAHAGLHADLGGDAGEEQVSD